MITLPAYVLALLVLGLLALSAMVLLGVLAGSFITYRSRAGLAPLPTIGEVRESLSRAKDKKTDEPRRPVMPKMEL